MPYADKAKQSRYQSERAKKVRLDWIEEQGGKCCKCGSTENLQVDHIDRSTKVTHKVWFWSEERRLVELAKCQVLCYECHRAKTNLEIVEWMGTASHGTESMYGWGSCRCDECREAHRIYQAEQRRKASYSN